MLSRGLQSLFTDIPLTVIGMMIFFVTYLAVVVWLFWRKDARRYFDQISKMPLEEQEGSRHERR